MVSPTSRPKVLGKYHYFCKSNDLFWHVLTSTDLKGQNIIVIIIILRGCIQLFMEKCIHGFIFKLWPLFDLFWPWPLLTSNDLWGQNKIVYNTYRYCMGIHAKNCSPWCIFTFLAIFDLFWPSVTFPDDLQWPLMIYKVKITYTILHGDIIWV